MNKIIHYIVDFHPFSILNSLISGTLVAFTDLKLLQINITVSATLADVILEVVVFTVLSYPVSKGMEWIWNKAFTKNKSNGNHG